MMEVAAELLPDMEVAVRQSILVERTSLLTGFHKYHRTSNNPIERELREELSEVVEALSEGVDYSQLCDTCLNVSESDSVKCGHCLQGRQLMEQHSSIDDDGDDDE